MDAPLFDGSKLQVKRSFATKFIAALTAARWKSLERRKSLRSSIARQQMQKLHTRSLRLIATIMRAACARHYLNRSVPRVCSTVVARLPPTKAISAQIEALYPRQVAESKQQSPGRFSLLSGLRSESMSRAYRWRVVERPLRSRLPLA